MMPRALRKWQQRGLAVLAEAYKQAHSDGVVSLFEFPYLPRPREPYPPLHFTLQGNIPAVASFSVCFSDSLTAHIALWPLPRLLISSLILMPVSVQAMYLSLVALRQSRCGGSVAWESRAGEAAWRLWTS